MTCLRVAAYPLDPGDVDEIVRRANEDLVPIYRDQEGFESLSVAATGDTIVSVSRWGSKDHAEKAAEAIRAWVKGQGDILGSPSANHIGEEVMSA